MERVVQFVAAVAEAPPAALEGGEVQGGATDALLEWLLAGARAADRGVRYRACQLLQSVTTALPESYDLSEVRRQRKASAKMEIMSVCRMHTET